MSNDIERKVVVITGASSGHAAPGAPRSANQPEDVDMNQILYPPTRQER